MPRLKIVSISLTTGDTICSTDVDVQYEKDPAATATLTLTSSCSCNPEINPVTVTLPEMLDSGIITFSVSHSSPCDEQGVTITATITQYGVPQSLSKTVNVKCPMP
jgi:hypothetical protein